MSDKFIESVAILLFINIYSLHKEYTYLRVLR